MPSQINFQPLTYVSVSTSALCEISFAAGGSASRASRMTTAPPEECRRGERTAGKEQAPPISIIEDPLLVTRERSIAGTVKRAFNRLKFGGEAVRAISANSLLRYHLQRRGRSSKCTRGAVDSSFMNAQRSTRVWYLRLLRDTDFNHAEQIGRFFRGPYRLVIRARPGRIEGATTEFAEVPTLALHAALRLDRPVELWREDKHLCTIDTIAGAGSMWVILPGPAHEKSCAGAPRPFNSSMDKDLRQQDAEPAPCCSASEQMFYHGMPLAHIVTYEEYLREMRRRRKINRLRGLAWSMKSN